ncbi:BMP family ABC transporter substrate-binding protein [Treponema sp.]|uniref:BMP family ABC transporter substrate-binding protein n=1 Tax=Treponema sp. TaxID=166 RepID=UPI002600BA8F|nr:BMP family ABC transporter substrate-binding protein [Treponema sp.]MCR5217216.1 BMP family ABC transporter substrate-binding protein [Treponema sp.]
MTCLLKNKYFICALTCMTLIFIAFTARQLFYTDYSRRTIKAGFVYIGDPGTAYTNNFCRAQLELEEKYGDRVKTIAKYNISEKSCEEAILDLVNEDCDIIFTTSYGYSKKTKEIAARYPGIQFCQATGDNAKEGLYLSNYHNFMGRIYEGRYIAGITAGLKMQELIDQDKIKVDQAIAGYVAAFPYSEVISGYTAFFLGIRQIVPQARMKVMYTNTWSNHNAEKKCASQLIDEGCVIISQHSDTTGSAMACEEASTKKGKTVYHVGYNQSMTDIAPTTSLISCRINWAPYILTAAEAVLTNKKIEKCIKSPLSGNDSAAGFDRGWVEMIGLNKLIAAYDTEDIIEQYISDFKEDKIEVFKGNYIGINPFDHSDTYNLRTPYKENSRKSSPTFSYVLKDVIEICN